MLVNGLAFLIIMEGSIKHGVQLIVPRTARRAAGWYGAKTLLIENGPSGGCCVNVG